jgi:hypothetical protein
MSAANPSAIAALLLLAACASSGDTRRDRAELLAPADDAYTLAASLVAEAGPRFGGGEGNARAVRWALHTLAELGFRNVHLEPLAVPDWQRGEIAVELRTPVRRRLEAVALGGSVATPPKGVEARVVAVGSVEELEKLPDAAVRGRIVYFSGRMERTRDGSGYEKAVPARRKGPAVAGRKGAKAVLIRSIGTGDDGFAHTGTTKYEDARKIPAAALSATDADALERQLAGKAVVRVRLVLTSHDAGMALSANVVGEIPGETSDIVLLGAHLDSWDITPGANDDAAGVAIVMAAARRVAALGRRPHRTIRVVLFANEEFGASGAKAYARAHAAELGHHIVVMEADSGSGAAWRLNAGVAEADWPFVAGLARDLGLEVGANGREGGTDVEPSRKLGVPELIVGQEGGAYFDVHHTAADTVDKLDRAGLAQATGVFAVLAHAASERQEGLGRLPPSP